MAGMDEIRAAYYFKAWLEELIEEIEREIDDEDTEEQSFYPFWGKLLAAPPPFVENILTCLQEICIYRDALPSLESS